MFVIAGVFLGRFLDFVPRKHVLLIGLVLWSGMVVFTAISDNFPEILACRIGLGLGEAVCNPAAFGLITDYFPQQRRTLANSIYNFGIYIGVGVAAGIGSLPWHVTFYVLGGIGGGLAVLFMLTVAEPTRGRYSQRSTSMATKEPHVSLQLLFSYLLSLDSVAVVSIAAGFRSLAGYALAGFAPTFFYNTFCSVTDDKSLRSYYALTITIAGLLSSFLGGYITQVWQKRNIHAAAYVPALGSILSCPFVGLFFYSEKIFGATELGLAMSVVFLFFGTLTAEVWAGPAAYIMQSILPRNFSGIGFGVYFFILTVLGGAGPEIVSQFNPDHVMCAGKSLTVVRPFVLTIIVCTAYLACAVLFFISAASIEIDTLKRAAFERSGTCQRNSAMRKFFFFAFVIAVLVATAFLAQDTFRN